MPCSGKILLVEDDPNLLQTLGAALAPPYEVFSRRTGLAALEVVTHQRPDLILLDNLLPDISGLTILRTLHRIFPSIPIILMTGLGSEDIAVEAFRAGARDYLKKPIGLWDLLGRVEAVLAPGQSFDRPPSQIGQSLKPPWPPADQPPYPAGVQRAIAFIEGHLPTPLSLDQVAREAGMSKFHFCRRFKDATGLTFREFLARRRIARAIELLRDRNCSVTEAYLDVGFKDISHFARVFRRFTGERPSSFRSASGTPPTR